MESSEIVDVVLGLFALVGTLGGAYLAYKAKASATVKKAVIPMTNSEKDRAYVKSGKDFVNYLKVWNSIEADITNLLSNSCIDRFVLLRGWNGIRDPKYTTAIYQYKSKSDKYQKFEAVELDLDYRDKLRKTYEGPVVFNIAEQKESLVKSIYELEGIKCAVWYYIISSSVDGVEERATTYCSFGSSSVDSMDPATLMRAQLLVSRIKAVMHKFEES